MIKSGTKALGLVVLCSLMIGSVVAQPFDSRPYRPEYDFGWGYLPPFGLGFDWKYPWVKYTYPSQTTVSYCARRFRSYDPLTRTYLGIDGVRHRCIDP